MIHPRTLWAIALSTGFHALLAGALAWGTIAPQSREQAPMLVVSQCVSYQPLESAEFEVPLAIDPDCPLPVIAPTTRDQIAVHLGDDSGELAGDLPGPPDEASFGLGLPGGMLSGSGGGQGLPGTASFFGATVAGSRFVYVVDCSRSMAGMRFRKAKRELLRSIGNLRPDQQYYVIFFGLDAYPMYFPQTIPSLVPAGPESWQRLQRWMGLIDPGTQPATNGRAAMLLAISLKPDAIYLLSDGAFTDDTVPTLMAMSHSEIPIHTIAFGSEHARRDLQRIAAQHHGTYRFVR